MSGSPNQKECGSKGNLELPEASLGSSSSDERPITDTPRKRHLSQTKNEIDFKKRSASAMCNRKVLSESGTSTSDEPSLSKDTSSQAQSLLETQTSVGKSQVQRTPSPLTGLTSKQTRSSHEKSFSSPDEYNSEESLLEKNRSDHLKEATMKVPSSLSTSPSATVGSPLVTSPSGSILNPLATDRRVSTSPNIGYRQSTSPSGNTLSPLAISSSAEIRQRASISPNFKYLHSSSPSERALCPSATSPLADVPQRASTSPNIGYRQSASPSGTTLSPLAISSSAEIRQRASIPPNFRNRHSSSPSERVLSPLATSPLAEVPQRASMSPNSRYHQSTSPSGNVLSPLVTSPLAEVPQRASTSPNFRSCQSTSSESVLSPRATSRQRASTSPNFRYRRSISPSGNATWNLSPTVTPSSAAVQQGVSTPPSSNFRSPQSTSPSTTVKTSDDISKAQTPLQITHSPKISPVQKTQSPQEGLTSKRMRSPEKKSSSPDKYTSEESPLKRNRSDKLEEFTKNVKIPPSTSPSATIQSTLAKSPPGNDRSSETSPSESVPSNLAAPSSANVRSPLVVSPSTSVQSPSNPPSLSIISPQASSPTSVRSPPELISQATSPPATESAKKDASCQVELCCKNCDGLVRLLPDPPGSEESIFTIGEILTYIEGSDENASLPPVQQNNDSIGKSTAEVSSTEIGKVTVHEQSKVPEQKDGTPLVPKEQLLKEQTTSLPGPSTLPVNSQKGLPLNKKLSDWALAMLKQSDQWPNILRQILGNPLKVEKKPVFSTSLVKDRKVTFVGTGSCGKTSMILKMLNKSGSYDEYRTAPVDYSFLMQFEDQRPMMDVVFSDSDTTSIATRRESYCQSDLFVMCFAINDIDSYLKLTGDLRHEILGFYPTAPMMLVGLKSDLRDTAISSEDNTKTPVVDKEFIEKTFEVLGFTSYLECSIYNESYIELYKSISRFLSTLE